MSLLTTSLSNYSPRQLLGSLTISQSTLIKLLLVWLHRYSCTALTKSFQPNNTPARLYTKTGRRAFQTLLSPCTPFSVFPDIIGKNVTVGAEDNDILLTCAKTYKDWFYNDNGTMTGVKPHFLEGIAKTNVHFMKPSWITLGMLIRTTRSWVKKVYRS
jgi:hypothetical protein